MAQIPLVSLQPILDHGDGGNAAVAQSMGHAFQQLGAFELIDHGVPDDVLQKAFEAARVFFAQSEELRLSVKVDKSNRGYVPMRQTHYPGNLPDLKESFNLGLNLTADDPDILAGKPLHGLNRWPDMPGFRADVEAYFNAMTALGQRLLGPLAICLQMSPEDLRALYRKPIAFMRLFHYPPTGRVDEKEFGAAEHQDYGFLTILAQDHVGGFEVRTPEGELVEIKPRPGGLIVNAGDMMSSITGGRLLSAPHRVVNRSPGARYSIPFFFDPDFDARFAAYPEASAGEFLLAKFNKFYKHRAEATA